jgi:hypothetical protein
MLASVSRSHPAELCADFQQYYDINIEQIEEQCTPRHAATLAAMLPQGSRVSVALDPAGAWGWQEHMLADIANTLRVIAWALTNGGKHTARPDMIRPPTRSAAPTRPRITDPEEYERKLSRLRR